mgnify:CR=1 FL=1|jgi:hypothetical protein
MPIVKLRKHIGICGFTKELNTLNIPFVSFNYLRNRLFIYPTLLHKYDPIPKQKII